MAFAHELTYFFIVKHEKRQNAIHGKWSHHYVGVHYWKKISVEFGGHIHQQLVWYKTLPITCISILGLYFGINHTKWYSQIL